MDMVSMGLLAAMGALATVAGASEDLESDVGYQSQPQLTGPCWLPRWVTPRSKTKPSVEKPHRSTI